MRETVTMNLQGRIVIPAAMRAELGLEPGSKLIVYVEDGGLRVATAMANVKRLQERVKREAPHLEGRSVVDEFLEEKHLDAAREEAKYRRLAGDSEPGDEHARGA